MGSGGLKIAGQVLPLLTGMGNDLFSQLGSWTALAMNQQRLDQALGLNDSLLNGQIQGGINLPFIGNVLGQRNPATSIPGQLQAFTDKYSPLVDQKYNDTLTNLSNMRQGLIGSGDQERKDINARFDSAKQANLADAASRGLTSSTIPYSIGANVERNRSDAIGGLEERLRQQRLGFESYALGTGDNAFSNTLNTQYNLLTNPLQSLMDLTNQKIGILQGVTDVYPDQSLRANISAASGAAMAPAVRPPDTGSSNIWGPAAGGLATGGGLALGKLAFGCIEGEAMVYVPGGGQKMLRDVDTGEFVKTAKGEFGRVVFKDYGHAHSSRSGMYRRITTSRGTQLILTTDHRVGGKTIGSYKVGDMIGNHRLMMVETVEPVPCGDLLIEGGGGYIVNGLAVDSMLEYMGVEKMIASTKVKANAIRP